MPRFSLMLIELILLPRLLPFHFSLSFRSPLMPLFSFAIHFSHFYATPRYAMPRLARYAPRMLTEKRLPADLRPARGSTTRCASRARWRDALPMLPRQRCCL